ncbi:hypothetical protein DVA67_035655 [Solirubrobacter sp. CPCC 204708]|uniref:DUF7919 domain-containing protein n=1 Tax=Solirubrobacter deserti TaxID=2282478 RepID=A0ABT4RVI7_9ACTN|nr:hypothetical protein [Solirubrobacter deserti]MBE2321307.1 hypothetical protein [Solirubrobacter deserti]MDA0142608.1 hypothetical protein [Solirubrobacter deserti]
MTYIPDGDPFPDSCPYGTSPDNSAIAVGWLDDAHKFPTGPVPDGLLAALTELGIHEVNVTRGVHACAFCPKPTQPRERPSWIYARSKSVGDYLLGHGEIHVRGIDTQLFAAPTLVVHYVDAHGYQPPHAVIEAVLRTKATN